MSRSCLGKNRVRPSKQTLLGYKWINRVVTSFIHLLIHSPCHLVRGDRRGIWLVPAVTKHGTHTHPRPTHTHPPTHPYTHTHKTEHQSRKHQIPYLFSSFFTKLHYNVQFMPVLADLNGCCSVHSFVILYLFKWMDHSGLFIPTSLAIRVIFYYLWSRAGKCGFMTLPKWQGKVRAFEKLMYMYKYDQLLKWFLKV